MREGTLYSLLSQLAGGQVYPYVVPLTEESLRYLRRGWCFLWCLTRHLMCLMGRLNPELPCRSMSGRQYLMTQMIFVSRRLMQ